MLSLKSTMNLITPVRYHIVINFSRTGSYYCIHMAHIFKSITIGLVLVLLPHGLASKAAFNASTPYP